MNWKIMVPNQPVRFDQGEPLFQAIPLLSNVCADLETADVSYQKLTDNPDLYRAYREWDQGRRRFHDQKAAGEVNPTDWQKDYFQGRDAVGRESGTYHMTKVKPPAGAGHFHRDDQPGPREFRRPGCGPDQLDRRKSNEKGGLPDDRCGSSLGRQMRRRTSLHDQRLDWIYSQSHVAIAMMDQIDDTGR